MKLFLAPHNDDETLFGAFTLLRKKPLVVVVTDSWQQFLRTEGKITADQRWQETVEALKVLGCPAFRMGLRDDAIDIKTLKDRLQRFSGLSGVFAPAVQGGNPIHDMVAQAALDVFGDVKQYSTYAANQFYTPGKEEVLPSPEELERKEAALGCYHSQIELPATAGHFQAVKGKSEWFI
jgi:LmbE family N-acetylglucosaminyl deacetylase